ncbi:MAG: hypothetical protein ABJC74_00110 [Gemmatimonadota bacterium]
MTGHRRNESGDPDRKPSDPIEDIDRLLRSVRFSPRASLGPELWGALPQGGSLRGGPATSSWSIAVMLAATLLLGAIITVFWQAVLPQIRVSTIDRCCFDLDGGGDADDGIAVTTRAGENVRRLTIYEDRDHSGTLTAADTIRFTRGKDPIVTPVLSAGLGVKKICCLDYDGGGKSDDGLLIIGTAPDKIAAAAIFENDGPMLPVLR